MKTYIVTLELTVDDTVTAGQVIKELAILLTEHEIIKETELTNIISK